MYDVQLHVFLLNQFVNFGFLKIFQKSPSRRWTTARRVILLCSFLGFRDGTAWRHKLSR